MSSTHGEKTLEEVLKSLSKEEKKVLEYFIRYRSVGELLALRELKGIYKVKDPVKIILKLVELGLIYRGIGCYNVSREVLKFVKERGGLSG